MKTVPLNYLSPQGSTKGTSRIDRRTPTKGFSFTLLIPSKFHLKPSYKTLFKPFFFFCHSRENNQKLINQFMISKDMMRELTPHK
jgi:hypothetical protein